MSKYQFKLNGKVVSAKELYMLGLVNYIDDRDDAESILGDLLQGKVVTLYEFTSDLFIQPGNNKLVISEDLSESMINLYRGAGIFASEKPVRDTTKRLVNLSPKMVYPMHGSCIDKALFPKYTEAIMKNNFAYSGILLGQKLENTIS